jgi:hypothetical protein
MYLKTCYQIWPDLAELFMRKTINYVSIEPCINFTKDALQDIDLDKLAENFTAELALDGRLESLELEPTENQLSQMKNMGRKYIAALTENIDHRFEETLPLLTAFSVFDPYLVPDKSDSQFKCYGKLNMQVVADHFYQDDPESRDEIFSEWAAFKYNLLRMKSDLGNQSSIGNQSSTVQNMLFSKFCS